MGVKVSYRATRGSHEVGTECSDPGDFFEELFSEEGFDIYKAKFNELPADKQQAFLAVFDGEVNMDENATGNMWLSENES